MLAKIISFGISTARDWVRNKMLRFVSRHRIAFIIAGTLAFASPTAVNAVVIASQTGGSESVDAYFAGQSVVTGSGGPWNNIQFNFFQYIAIGATTQEIALGEMFILAENYLGSPEGLSSSTTGFVAQSQSVSGGRWIFEPAVVLQPLTKYYFLMGDGQSLGGSSLVGRADSNSSTGLYMSGAASINYTVSTNDFDYVLRGDVFGVPEPATLALFGLGLAGLAAMRRRKLAA